MNELLTGGNMDLKEKYVAFFKRKNHKILPAASLIPDNNTTLFTSAGIQQLVPYMVNEEDHPICSRLTNYQKCLRLTDIQNIGDSYHHTFFEMLGNWSINDYFKNEVIEFSYEFLTKELKLDPNRLAVTVFAGDESIARDEETANKWKELGIAKERIAYLGYDDNWWPSVNEKGPCGTDTEIFYWRSNEPVPNIFDPNDDNWVEIWNNVFIQYNRNDEMRLIKLGKKYIDTGMGVERMTSILEGENDNYRSSLFRPLIDVIEKHSKKEYDNYKKDMRIIADHIRAIVMISSENDKIYPTNKDRGYVLRRLIRRMIISVHKLDIEKQEDFIVELVNETVNLLKKDYPYTENDRVTKLIIDEAKKFQNILLAGQKKVYKAVEVLKNEHLDAMDAKIIFKLYETHGIPFDLIYSILDEEKIIYDTEKVNKIYEQNRVLSRKNAEEKFGNSLSGNVKTKTLKNN